MRTRFKWLVAVCSLVFFHSCWAASASAAAAPSGPAAAIDETSKIRTSLKQHLPDLTIEEITISPISGLYQISAGPTVLYMSQDGRFAFSGDIIDLSANQKNLTEAARKKARLAGLKALGEENMVIFSPKNPQYVVNVFTDVDCGYCRKLQSEMADINAKGIAIRYLAFPRTGPNTPTFDKMVKIWCSKDKTKAMSLAQEDKAFDGTACGNNTVLREFEYGMRIGVAGTPTMIFEDGTLFPGYLPPDKLLEAVKQIREQSKAKQAG